MVQRHRKHFESGEAMAHLKSLFLVDEAFIVHVDTNSLASNLRSK